MKKCFFIASLLLIMIPLAQTYAQKFGVRAGVQFPSMLQKDDDDTYTDDNKMKLGFQVGGVFEYPLMDALSLEGGLIMSLKGAKMKEEDGDYSYTQNTNLFYLVIPITAKYTADLGNIKLYGQAGPSLGIGISGKLKWTEDYDGDEETGTETVEWGSEADDDHYKRPDIGLHIGGGVVVSGIQFGLFYELGMANLSPSTHNGFKIKNRTFGLTATYFLGK